MRGRSRVSRGVWALGRIHDRNDEAAGLLGVGSDESVDDHRVPGIPGSGLGGLEPDNDVARKKILHTTEVYPTAGSAAYWDRAEKRDVVGRAGSPLRRRLHRGEGVRRCARQDIVEKTRAVVVEGSGGFVDARPVRVDGGLHDGELALDLGQKRSPCIAGARRCPKRDQGIVVPLLTRDELGGLFIGRGEAGPHGLRAIARTRGHEASNAEKRELVHRVTIAPRLKHGVVRIAVRPRLAHFTRPRFARPGPVGNARGAGVPLP